MKVKELDKTVNLAWSPAAHMPVMLAAGSAAQQLDASFNTTASLDIYDLNLNEPGLDMELLSSVQSPNRFHKLVWGSSGKGVIVGGCDNGKLQMYNASKVVTGEEGLLCSPDRHTGPVKAIDFNPFQANLLASGASESEIFIWDLNNVKTPMTPGVKSQPAEDVMWLSWNKQVQHILASVFPTRCVVWDLRKNETIIKLSDSNSRVRWKEVAWHPDVATQLCLASEDDSNPVIQLWDLRFATTPIKSLEGHQKGVLSIAWCAQDPELLVSCGKDSRILCWNPNATEQGEDIVCEIMTGNQWNFEVTWCPRNPSLIATSSFDGHASVFSLVGGQQQMATTNKIADSFPGMEQYAEAPVVQPPHHSQVTLDLRKAPKWLKRPAGVSFGFGGKLVSFDSQAIYVSQVVTEPVLIQQSQRLQQLLACGQLREICQIKSDPVWTFVGASLEPDYRLAMRTLLGFTQEQLELNKYIGQPVNAKLNDIDGLTDEFSLLSQDGSEDEGKVRSFNSSELSTNGGDKGTFQSGGMAQQRTDDEMNRPPFKINIGEDKEGVICRALLAGNVELAVDLCMQEGRMTDAVILAASAAPHLLASTQHKYFQQNQNYLSYLLSAVVTQDWNLVVTSCDLTSWGEALAAVLTYATDDQIPALCERLGDRLERDGGLDSQRNSEICFVAAGQLSHLIRNRIAADISTEALQELVELVLVAKRGDIHSAGLGPLLDRYAQLLAAQGAFDTALMYLSSSQEVEIEELRERLYIASGQNPYPTPLVQNTNSYFQAPKQTSYSAKPPLHQAPSAYGQQYPPSGYTPLDTTSDRKPSIPLFSSFQPSNDGFPSNPHASAQSSFPATAFPPSVPPLQQHQATHSSETSGNQFAQPTSAFTPLMSSQNPQPPGHLNSEPGALPPSSNVPLSNHPHRSSPTPSIGGSTRKYIVDPSVSGGVPPYRNTQPAPGLFHRQQPSPLYTNSVPAQAHQTQPFNSIQPQSSQLHTQMPTQLYNNTVGQPYNNTVGQPYNNNVAQPYSNTLAHPYKPPPVTNLSDMKAPVASGWNDPPTLSSFKRAQPKEVYQPAPITHPIFSSQQDVAEGPGVYLDRREYQQGTPFGIPHSAVPPPVVQPPPTLPKAAEPPKPKPPLPEEYMYLQTVFEGLRQKCMCIANNPQLTRKLEGVSRKLEILYDSLRENKLSGVTLSSLNQLAKLVQGNDYINALHLHNQLVSGSDFLQISAFMPGIKALIQSALQFGVYF